MSQSSNANRIQKGILAIDKQMFDFIENEVLPKVGVDSDSYWSGFEKVIKEFTPRNKALLATRAKIQQQIDQWHLDNPAKNGDIDYPAYKAFLQEIGYLLPEGDDFKVSTQNVDDEIAHIAGPQLVVPVRNARYALNATNARWGSLYDALYGTDVISDENGQEAKGGYNPTRGAAVVAYAKKFLDENFALASGSYTDATGFKVVDGKLEVVQGDSSTELKDAAQFAGFVGEAESPTGILLKNNNLHAEIQIDGSHPVGKDDLANIKDVLLESAITAIQDCEDSIAAVDAEEKVEVYRNWFGLMNGDLQETFEKGGKTRTRKQNPDREYTTPDGGALILPGRSLLLIRNVGHLMQNPAILVDLGNGQEQIFEGLMDGLITPLLTLNDLKGKRVGVPSMSSSPIIFAKRALADAGIGVSEKNMEVEFIVFSASDLPIALKNGAVDALAMNDPTAAVAQKEFNLHTLVDSAVTEPYSQQYCCTAYVSDNLASSNPEAAAKYTRAVQKASAWIQKNQDETAKLQVDNKWVAGDAIFNAAVLKTYNYIPSVKGAYDAFGVTAKQLQDVGMLDKSIDVEALQKKSFILLKGVEDTVK